MIISEKNDVVKELLLVDDDPVILYIHQVILESLNPVFLNDFLSGELAITYLYHPDNKDKQFLILLDINMPGMDGWAFLEHLKQHPLSSSIDVVIVSSSKESSDQMHAKEFPMVIDYLLKPISEQSIKDLLSKNTEIKSYFWFNNK